MKSLKLFNAVLFKGGLERQDPFISDLGFIIEPGALWAQSKIYDYYSREELNGNQLNATFHKSWDKIKNSSRFELYMEQIKHYLSTYGSNFSDEVYIPNEVLSVPDTKITFKVIKALTKEELTEKSLNLLKSGIALKEETVDDIISLLVDELNYTFTGLENIKNKEAIVKIAENYGVYPSNPTEFLRFIVYRSTGKTLLIKNTASIIEIKNSQFNPSQMFKNYGLEKLATIFNRFKPLFLAYKGRCPKTINKIAKLSKKLHKPLVENPLGLVTSRQLTTEDSHWLDNATTFSLLKALKALHNRTRDQDIFMYKIRNGKSWVQEEGSKRKQNLDLWLGNYSTILNTLASRINLKGKKIYLPDNVEYGLPTSEKMFVGNIPQGTKFFGKKLAVGIYWENSWGARDLDLSGLPIDGSKVGWNASYNYGNSLLYSGDMTNASNGAVEYLYANNGLNEPTLVMNNVFSGQDNSGYKIIVGKGSKVSKDYMMNPNKLFAQVRTESVEKQTILGILIPEGDRQSFVVLNVGAGQLRVSSGNNLATQALLQEFSKGLSLNAFLKYTEVEYVSNSEEADIDLSLEKLEKDTFLKLLLL